MGIFKKKKKQEIVDQTKQETPLAEEVPKAIKQIVDEQATPQPVKETVEELPQQPQGIPVYPYQEELQIMIELMQRQNEHLEEIKVTLRRGIELAEQENQEDE